MPVKSSNSPQRAPAADAFVAFPASWYLFCAGRELRRGPLSRRILGRQLVAFRTESGRAVVMDAHCAHLGADLGCGSVVGETIRCPFHHWRYGTDGVCTFVPSRAEPPPFARLRTYPVEERHGSLFFFNGPEPLFPLPFFLGEDAGDYVAGQEFHYVADTTWYMNAAHAFDRQHFAAVHDRELLAPPAIDCPAPFARRNSYPAKVVGHTVFDRILRVAAGRTVNITLTIWGGTFAVITAQFERLRSGFLMAMEPLDDGQTSCHGIVYVRRSAAPLQWLDPLRLRTRRLFTYGYLREEARQLRSTRYNPASLGDVDQDMIDFFHWVAALPQAAPNQKPTRSADEKLERNVDVAVLGRDAASVSNTVSNTVANIAPPG
ncbi:MAG TPA: Rieske 2Fe-2S domain-containing protein [Thermoanaerobaculia bacterium]|jgi:nitrite reductase/ring-hydroxylating ferredoxin subunit|nr:Rieske 2Fe-2S domain-containing protein [Thermoanaerobaculia bacterium]